MVIVFLVVTFALLWWGSFLLFDRDLASPAMLLISGYTLSVTTAFVSDFALPFDYHWGTYVVLVSGVLLFLVPAYTFKQGYAASTKRLIPPVVTVDFSRSFLWLHALLCITVTVVTIFVYVRVLSGLDVEVSAASAATSMRNYCIAHPEGTGSTAVLVVKLVQKVFLVTGYFLLLVWARNCAVKRCFNDDKLLFLNCFCYGVLIMTDGGRGALVAYGLAGTVLYFMFNRMMNGARFRFSLKVLAVGMVTFIVGCVGFYGMLWATGRTTGEFDLAGVWHHTSFYLGGSVPLLDNFLETYTIGEGTDILGKETFYSTLQQINRLGFLDIEPYSVHLEFRPEVYEGNVYTGLRSYVNDFGYEGLIVLPLLYSVCVNWLYYAAERMSRRRPVATGLVLYAMLMYPVFADFIRCFFFLSFFNLNTVITVFGVMFLRTLLLSLRWMRYRPV